MRVGGIAFDTTGKVPDGTDLDHTATELDPFAWHGRERDTKTMSSRELFLGSSFQLRTGGERGAPAWTAWGRFATGGFDAKIDRITLSGDVTTALLGADVDAQRWLAGAALSSSRGEGPFTLTGETRSPMRKGTIESTLTGVYSYAGLDVSDRISLWVPRPSVGGPPSLGDTHETRLTLEHTVGTL